jgi:FkbM family methyltransferase
MFDEFGISEIRGEEGQYSHIIYHDITFAKSSFLKEWVDKYIDSDISVVLDIGALDGGDSLRLASWYPEAKIYTIEASPHNFDVINKKLGDKILNIKTFNYVMSEINGFINFYQTTYIDDCGVGAEYMVMGSIYDIIESKKNIHNLKTIDTISVESITFDSFCEKNSIESVDVVHMDVEGATYNIILGMNKILPKLIFTEKEGNEYFKNKTIGGNDELVKLLSQKGYELKLELSNDYLFVLK